MMWINKMMMFLPLVTMVNFIMKNKKLLMSLLSLEMIALSLIFYILFLFHSMKIQLSLIMIMILSFSACEASIGLSLLVMMSRSIGSDKLYKLSLNKC